MTPGLHACRFLAVTLISAATLAFEILLVRVFAIEQFYHFAYMAIGVAMLGFGSAGTLVAMWRRQPGHRLERWLLWAAAATGPLLLVVPALSDVLRFDATQLPVDPTQWVRLGLLYIVLALPFAFGGLVILLSVLLDPAHPGRIYGASMLGAGAGAAAALATLWAVNPVQALALPGLLASVGGALVAYPVRHRIIVRGCAATAVAAAACVVSPPWSLDISPYKGLPQVEAYPNAQRVVESSSPIGWVVGVRAQAFRHAPGLSLAYRGAFPDQMGVFVDGQLAGALTPTTAQDTTASLWHWLPSALPFAIGVHDRVLVLGAGGGTDVWTALHSGAAHVTAVELHPDILALQRDSVFAAAPEDVGRRIAWVSGDARSYAARTRDSFDLVIIGLGGEPSGATAGVYALNEDFMHTREAYVEYLGLLRPGGILAITRWLQVPPRANVRVVLTAIQALQRVTPTNAAHAIVIMRTWGTATTLVKPDGFTPAELDTLATWAAERWFDIEWPPRYDVSDTPFNAVDDPVLSRAAHAAFAGDDTLRAFVATYPFSIEPVDDASPYAHHFLNLESLLSLIRADVGEWLPFAEWGYLALMATLLQAIVLATLLLILPVAIKTRVGWRAGMGSVVVYFGALGFAYLAAEIAAIQQLSLLLGHPVYAVTAVLTVLLVCSGLGSMWSDRASPARAVYRIAALSGLLVVFAFGLLDVVHWVHDNGLIIRVGVATLTLSPVAFLMGVPFPVGLRAIAGEDSTLVAWAWAVNGFASVVAAPLTALIVIELGTRVLFAAATGAYGVAVLALVRRRW